MMKDDVMLKEFDFSIWNLLHCKSL